MKSILSILTCLAIFSTIALALPLNSPHAKNVVVSSYTINRRSLGTGCTYDEDCGDGECTKKYTHAYPNGTMVCDCNDNVINYEGGVCNYKKNDRVTSFLISLFLGGFGVDYFYLADGNSQYYELGAIQCLLLVIGIFILVACACCTVNGNSNCLPCIGIGALLASVVWWTVRWIQIATGPCHFGDGNNVCLGDW